MYFVSEKEKLHDLGMVSNQVLSVIKMKIYLYSSDSKTRIFVLSEYIYIISSYFKFGEQFRLKQKKKCTSSLKNMPYASQLKK